MLNVSSLAGRAAFPALASPTAGTPSAAGPGGTGDGRVVAGGAGREAGPAQLIVLTLCTPLRSRPVATLHIQF